jgi:hypothetical protein
VYTKEDVGTTVYLPEWGDKPLKIIAYQEGSSLPIGVGPDPNKIIECFFSEDGKAYGPECLPTLSRTPYIVGQPFRCVTERPQRGLEEIKASEEPPTKEEWDRLREELANSSLKVGDRVEHIAFGKGIVLRKRGGPELTEGVEFYPSAQYPGGLFQWVSRYYLTRLTPFNND